MARATTTALVRATDPRKTGTTGRVTKPRDPYAQAPGARGRSVS